MPRHCIMVLLCLHLYIKCEATAKKLIVKLNIKTGETARLALARGIKSNKSFTHFRGVGICIFSNLGSSQSRFFSIFGY